MEKTITLKINGMHCTSCAMNIDGELEDTPGVKEAKTSYVKNETAVVFDDEKVQENVLCEIIKKLGYKVAILSTPFHQNK
ncbi:MAG TPA: cation transporter [Candidatus Kapabacteria bacterium]|nr:cation transporter [Candidatus Kapabacteria bacterium]